MYAILLLLSAICMMVVTRIKNDILRAAIGLPIIVSMFILAMLTFASAISAQWVPDRPDYSILSEGNFSLRTESKAEAISICKQTLDYNSMNMRTVNVDKKDDITPIWLYCHDNKDSSHVLFAYVTKKVNGGYVVWFRYLPEEPCEFIEDFVILNYEGME